jgi:hypothetical protein
MLIAGNGLGKFLALHVHVTQELGKARVGRVELDGPLESVDSFARLSLAHERDAQMSMGLGEVGLQPQRLGVSRPRLGIALELPVGVTEVMVHGRQAGLEPDRFLAVRQCFLRPGKVQEQLAQIGLGRRVLGVNLDGATEMFECFLKFAQLAQDITEVVMANAEIRLERNRLAKLLGRLVAAAQPLECQPQVAPRLGIIGAKAQCGPAAAGGSIKLADRAIGFGQVGMEGRRVGPQRDRTPDQLDRARVVAPLMVQHTEQVQRLGARRVLCENLVVQPGGLAQSARLVVRDGGPEYFLHGETILARLEPADRLPYADQYNSLPDAPSGPSRERAIP